MRHFVLICTLLFVTVQSGFAQNSAAREEAVLDATAKGATVMLPRGNQLPPPVLEVAQLYDNGPLVNAPGGGFGGNDASLLQQALTMTLLGFGHQQSAGNRMADDFTVPPGDGWTIDSIKFYAYQTGSTTTSTITAVNLRIWNGAPNAGGTVIWGDTMTNVMTATRWSQIYRATTGTPTDATRPAMESIVSLGGLNLAPGTYWLDWQSNGSLASGPWAPPITINGQTTTGNALQFTTAGGWAAANDGGSLTQQGLPFKIYGEASAPPGPVLSEDFEGGVFPPAGWSSYIAAGDTGWRSATLAPHAGTTHAYNRYQPAGTLGSKFLVTPRLNLTAETTYELSFWMRRAFTIAYPPDTVYIKVSTTDSLPVSFTTTVYKCYTGDIADTTNPNVYGVFYKKFTTPLPTIVEGTTIQFVAFDHQDDDGQSIYLDDVLIQPASGPVHDIGVSGLSLASISAAVESNANHGQRMMRGEKSLLEQGLMTEEELLASQASAVHGPALIPVITQESASFRAIVRNYGAFEEASYQVAWSLDGVPQTPVSNSQPLAVGAADTIMLSWATPTVGPHTARAWTIMAGDANPANDTSATLNFEIPSDDLVLFQGFDDITVLTGQGWFFQNNSSPVGTTNWFQGNNTVFEAYSGAPTSYIGANFNATTGANTISNWMLTPEISLVNGDTVSFWTRTVTASTFPDRLELRLSTAGASTNVGSTATSVGDFTTLLLSVNATLVQGGYPDVWTKFSAVLSGIPPATTGRVGFRYFVTDGGPSGNNSNYIGVDDARIARSGPTGVDDDNTIPQVFAVEQNYPNPFNPSTMIRYSIPVQARVVVKVYNVLGQVISQLKDEVRSAGTYEAIWNGTTETGTNVSSGVYFYRVEATPLNGGDAFVSQKKMLMLK